MVDSRYPASRRFRYAAATFAGVAILGTVGYELIEGWGLIESLYMTLITLTTVGYGEVRPLSAAGRVFTMVLLLGGVGAAAYMALTAVELLVDREMRWVLRGNRMADQVKKMHGHVILCGYGRVGRLIAAEFVRRRVPFVIVERDRDVAIELSGVAIIRGDATDDDTLRDAGIGRAQSLVCALASGSDNAFIALTARQLNPHIRITARSDTDGMDQKLLRAGADRVVSPYRTGALRMAVTTLQPNVVDFMNIVAEGDSSDLRLEEVRVNEGSPFIGQSLRQIEFRQRFGLMVVGIKREGRDTVFNPESTEALHAGDILLLIGPSDKLETCAAQAAGHTAV